MALFFFSDRPKIIIMTGPSRERGKIAKGPWFGFFQDPCFREKDKQRKWEVQYFIHRTNRNNTFAGTGYDDVGFFTIDGQLHPWNNVTFWKIYHTHKLYYDGILNTNDGRCTINGVWRYPGDIVDIGIFEMQALCV